MTILTKIPRCPHCGAFVVKKRDYDLGYEVILDAYPHPKGHWVLRADQTARYEPGTPTNGYRRHHC